MAKLDDLLKDLNLDLTVKSETEPSAPQEQTGVGHKRRAWLEMADVNISPESTNTVQNKLNTNLTQTEHKPDTNQTQSTHKVDTQPNTNQTQTKHKLNTKYTQTKHKVDTQPDTKWTQKLDTKWTQTLTVSSLLGVQRNLLLFIFEECKKSRSHITEPLSIVYIAAGVNIAFGSVKTSLSRLCEKQFLIKNSFKNGRGGWSVYEIPDAIYRELIQMETQRKLNTNQTQTRHKLDTQLDTQPNTNLSSSSSYIKTTTTSELPEEWLFDISPYEKFGFNSSQLKQLVPLGVISARDVEQSLMEFIWDFENNSLPRIVGSKLGFLMGIFRKGQTYASEGYRNDQEAAIVRMTAIRKGREENLLKSKFWAWEDGLTQEERTTIEKSLPTHLIVLHGTFGFNHPDIQKWLFDYFMRTHSNT